KLQPRFTGFLSDARTEDDDPTPDQVLKASGPNIQRVRKRYGMAEVVRLGGGASRILVHQDDLAPHAFHQQGGAGPCPNEPAANHADFHLQPHGGRNTRVAGHVPDGERPADDSLSGRKKCIKLAPIEQWIDRGTVRPATEGSDGDGSD